MRAAGCNIDFPLTDLAVIGLVEVLPKLREFFRVADLASEVFASNPPDAVVLVDFPGFNWHIAKRAKKHGIPVFYYLPPQLWAWGSWRVEKMKRYVDHVLCNLPFEHEWYASRGVSADFVGHPFLDVLDSHPLDKAFLESWGQHEGLQVAVLPGSREREVRNIWPMQLAAIRELSRRHGKTRYLIACLTEQHAEQCRSLLTEEDRKLDLNFFVDRTSEIIDIADCSLMKSGSVSLEMMARGTPAVVLYHVSRSLDFARKRLANVNSMSLPNLIAGRTIMPEFLAVGSDRQATIERCIAAMDRLLGDRDERLRQRGELLELRQICGPAGASGRAASIVLQRLGLSPAMMAPSFNASSPRVAA
jgi:lipid-A-disaccharide synthase